MKQQELTRLGNRGEIVASTSTATTESLESEQPTQRQASTREEGAEGQEDEAAATNGFSDISVDFPQLCNEAGQRPTEGNRPDNEGQNEQRRESGEDDTNHHGIGANSVHSEMGGQTQEGVEEANVALGPVHRDPGGTFGESS